MPNSTLATSIKAVKARFEELDAFRSKIADEVESMYVDAFSELSQYIPLKEIFYYGHHSVTIEASIADSRDNQIILQYSELVDWINGERSFHDILYGDENDVPEDEVDEFNTLDGAFDSIPETLKLNLVEIDKLLNEASDQRCEPIFVINKETVEARQAQEDQAPIKSKKRAKP